ncbi:MAG: formylmethanofuran dehydrogenase subunit E family protein [Methanomassiliicoccales archaeon]|nr:formylmethanofuran dehydrogenase subunit E family protein [Methanomassiliicoccales archaeon]
MVDLPDELKQLKRFHGHLGPFVVIGYRMGTIARKKLQGKMEAIVFTGSKVPLSCIIDGIQFSSSCTLGKGNISVQEKDEARAHFVNDKELVEIKLHDEARRRIETTCTKDVEEAMALELLKTSEAALFSITSVETTPFERTVKLR